MGGPAALLRLPTGEPQSYEWSGHRVTVRPAVRLAGMNLEEKTLDEIGDRCEECGAKLTPAEIQAAMESGGPALCSIHADELVPLGEDELEFEDE